MAKNKKRGLGGTFRIALYVSILLIAGMGLLSWKLIVAPKAQVGTRDDKPAKIELTKNIDMSKTPTATPTAMRAFNNSKPRDEEPWGIAKQIDENTWTMKIGEDQKMATPNDVFDALNTYRRQKGVGSLTWDDKLAELAGKRAATFQSIQKLDGHAGFSEYFKDEQNLKNIGFWGVGENSSYGFRLEGVHLIEWIFAGDKPHDDNQLDPSWTHVGIGVASTGVDVIFGKDKM